MQHLFDWYTVRSCNNLSDNWISNRFFTYYKAFNLFKHLESKTKNISFSGSIFLHKCWYMRTLNLSAISNRSKCWPIINIIFDSGLFAYQLSTRFCLNKTHLSVRKKANFDFIFLNVILWNWKIVFLVTITDGITFSHPRIQI